ncbi:ImmA/IrrE family metallo-endopeptidase [Paraperlucidibaca sp.]|uniref:ImmA/IrrE family metallo-endopeptidase n=1 Tax=Paraperlucidibaca sp. TaxID=2708021 RepID=UPI0030F49FC3
MQDLAQGLATKSENIFAWERGEKSLTVCQAQKLASVTRIPFGFLFLQTPPEESLPLPDLRTIGSEPLPRPSVNLLDTVRDTLQKQAWYIDYLKDQHAADLAFVSKFNTSAPVTTVANDIKASLGLTNYSRSKSNDEYFRTLVKSAEDIGILVMRSGYVGGNTRRTLDVSEFRGFAISDRQAPVIFINSTDAPAARLFTLLHELAHIWIGTSGISNASHQSTQKEEVFCNAVAGEFLVPTQEFVAAWNSDINWMDNLPVLSLNFHVSKLVIARKASDLGLIEKQEYTNYHRDELAKFRSAKKGGSGDYYANANAKNSSKFTQAVIHQALSGDLLLRDAGRLLGVNPSKIRTFAESLST